MASSKEPNFDSIIGIIIGTIIAILLGSSQIAAASISWGDRPAINPDFDPDESCLFDIAQDKCDPGTEGECPEGFRGNEDDLCVPQTLVDGEWKWLCPEGYHDGGELDETGQCYPNSQECDAYTLRMDGTRSPYVITTRSDGIGQTCKDAYEVCEDDPEHEACRLIERSTEVNSDDDTDNDIPPYGTIFFCDHPSSSPGECYDRNENPEEFCEKYPEYEAFCKAY